MEGYEGGDDQCLAKCQPVDKENRVCLRFLQTVNHWDRRAMRIPGQFHYGSRESRNFLRHIFARFEFKCNLKAIPKSIVLIHQISREI